MRLRTFDLFVAACAAVLTAGCGGNVPYGPTSGANGGSGGGQNSFTDSSVANAINDSNLLVGSDTGAVQHAVLFVTAGNVAPTSYSVKDLGGFGGAYMKVLGINANGDATGWGVDSVFAAHGFLYTFETSSLSELGLAPGSKTSLGMAINDSDQVAGESENNQAVHPLYWDAGSGGVYVADPVNGTASEMTGISSSGLMCGIYSNGTSDYLPFYSTKGGPPVDLTSVMTVGTPHGVSASGVIVGDHGQTAGWTYDTVAKQLHAVPTVGPASLLAINSSGVIAGSDQSGSYIHAQMWKNGTETDLGVLGESGVVDLNTLIPSGSLSSGDYLVEATGINASGQICCNTHNAHAVILTPVSNTTIARPRHGK